MPDSHPTASSSSPELKLYEKDVGTWDAEIVLRFDPSQPPQLSRGVAVSKLIAGGQWLVTDFKNETTGFEGHGIYGWDRARKIYTGTWVDNMRTAIIVAEGHWDESNRTMTFTSQAELGGKLVKWREVTEVKDANTQIFRTLFPMPDGSDHEMMTITYRRRT